MIIMANSCQIHHVGTCMNRCQKNDSSLDMTRAISQGSALEESILFVELLFSCFLCAFFLSTAVLEQSDSCCSEVVLEQKHLLNELIQAVDVPTLLLGGTRTVVASCTDLHWWLGPG